MYLHKVTLPSHLYELGNGCHCQLFLAILRSMFFSWPNRQRTFLGVSILSNGTAMPFLTIVNIHMCQLSPKRAKNNIIMWAQWTFCRPATLIVLSYLYKSYFESTNGIFSQVKRDEPDIKTPNGPEWRPL